MGEKLLGFVANGKMVCEVLCGTESNPKFGPFLMVVTASLPKKDRYGALLTELTGDNKLAELFDPPGPAHIRVLRCRPAFFNAFRKACVSLIKMNAVERVKQDFAKVSGKQGDGAV